MGEFWFLGLGARSGAEGAEGVRSGPREGVSPLLVGRGLERELCPSQKNFEYVLLKLRVLFDIWKVI